MIKQKYPGAVSSKSVKDKELERKKEQKRKPGEGLIHVLTILLILKTLLFFSCWEEWGFKAFKHLAACQWLCEPQGWWREKSIKCGGILRIHNISLLPNIFSVSFQEQNILAKNVECLLIYYKIFLQVSFLVSDESLQVNVHETMIWKYLFSNTRTINLLFCSIR